MGSLSQARSMGGVGSILMLVAGFLFFIPLASPVVSLIGFILVLVAVKHISEAVADAAIFKNMLISVVMGIVGTIVATLVVLASLLQMFPGILQGDFTPSGDPGGGGMLMTLVAGLLLLWIFFVISAVFLRKSYTSISDRLNIGLFGTAALLYLIGAITIVIMVGFFLLFIALILQTVAFFSIEEREAAPVQATPPPVETQPQAQEAAPPSQ